MLVDHHRRHKLSLAGLRAFMRQAQEAAGVRGDYSVCLAGDAEIKELNRRYRHCDEVTDVLAFAADEGEPADGRYLGDLVVSVDTARRQAEELGHPVDREVRVLILHGLLHLAGFDHETDQGEMQRIEEKLRSRLGLPVGLITRAQSASALPVATPLASGSGRVYTLVMRPSPRQSAVTSSTTSAVTFFSDDDREGLAAPGATHDHPPRGGNGRKYAPGRGSRT
jgi:probable rRNA maturation factor